MAETIGKRLCQARLAKGLTIDEAAHVTKMRPDKILALENDDYSRFGNGAYAKGFLQIYGRFLGVDLSDRFPELESPVPLNVNDYQYLNNAPEPPKAQTRPQRQVRPPSVVPLLVVISVLAAGAFVFWVFENFKRIDPAASRSSASRDAITTPAPAKTDSVPARAEKARTAPAGEHSNPVVAPKPAAPASGSPQQIAGSNSSENVEIRRAEAIAHPGAAAKAQPETASAPGGVSDVVVEPIKKTWVRIHKGAPDSPPIFEDYLYPPGPTLKLPRGARYFIEVRDQTAVQIRKNGTPIAYQAPGISIQ